MVGVFDQIHGAVAATTSVIFETLICHWYLVWRQLWIIISKRLVFVIRPMFYYRE